MKVMKLNFYTVRLKDPSVPLECRLRGFLTNYQLHVVFGVIVIIAWKYGQYQWRVHQKQKKDAKTLSQKLLKYLSDQTIAYNEKIASVNTSEHQKIEKPKIAVRHLQDAFWKDKDIKVWNMAVREVESDSRIEKSQDMMGHVRRAVWSWQGPPLVR